MSELSPADRAVLHLVRRVLSDPDFAWLMIGTEGLNLCFEAIAARTGEDVGAVRDRIESRAASRGETPEIVALRKRVDELQRQAAAPGIPDPGIPDPLRGELTELLWTAESRPELVRLDSLRELLAGNTAHRVLCGSAMKNWT